MGLQLVDDKGRVAIPANLRVTLEKNSGHPASSKEARTAILTTHETEPCLVAYDEEHFNELIDELKQRAREHSGEQGRIDSNIWRGGVGISENIAFDPSGRFVMPGVLCRRGNISKNGAAFFHGVGPVIEIWDPATLLAHPTVNEDVKDACRYFLEEKGIEL